MLRDLDAGRDVPAAAVPRAGRPEPARARRQRGLVVLPALPAPHQPLRAADRLRRASSSSRRRARRPTASSSACRCPSTASSSRCVVFLGGFSAATAMIVVDSLALSKMITNDIILPMLLRRRRMEDIYWITLFYTRLAMLAVVALGFAWARMERGQLLLVEMGLLSFIAVTQCAPAILLGLYWRRGNRRGAFAGISAGFFVWFYTLIIPALGKEEISRVRRSCRTGRSACGCCGPTAFLGLDGLDTISHGVFWSLLLQRGALRAGVAAHRAGRRRSGPGRRLRGGRGRGQAGAGGARDPVRARDRAARPSLRRRRGRGGHRARAVRRPRRPPTSRCPSCSSCASASSGSSPPPWAAAAARIIVEDHFTISKEEAQQLVTSFQRMQQSLRVTEEEVKRGERLLASVVESVDDCIFTADTDRPARDHEPGGPPAARLRARRGEPASATRTCSPPTSGAARAASWPRSRWGAGWSGQVTGRRGPGDVFPAHLALTAALRRPRPAHGHGGRAARPDRAGGDAAAAHPAREAGLARRDGGGGGPRDPQSAGRDQDGHQPAVLPGGGRQPAVAGDGPVHPVRHRRDRGHHQQPARLDAGRAARAQRVRAARASWTRWWRRRRARGGPGASRSATGGSSARWSRRWTARSSARSSPTS